MRFIDHDAHLVKLLTLCAAAPENFPAFCVIWVTHHPKMVVSKKLTPKIAVID
jgi:hypothetical protein